MNNNVKHTRRCPSCGYEANQNNWTRMDVESSDGYSWLTCREFDLKTNRQEYIGTVSLLACPQCRTVIY